MSRIWYLGLVGVTAVAALKTFLVLTLALPGMWHDLRIVSGLFVLFFALTAAVAYFSFTYLQATLIQQRGSRRPQGAGEPVAKETVILNHAPDWGLSQSEADVAIFVAKGFSNAEIAEMRGCAIATVKSQLSGIYRKSGLESRYQLIAFVTDEVCSLANEPEADDIRVETRKKLPLVGRARRAA